MQNPYGTLAELLFYLTGLLLMAGFWILVIKALIKYLYS